MNHNLEVKYADIYLRPLKREDIEKLRVWRNDKEATRFLRPLDYITAEIQSDWFESYLQNESEITFAIIENKELNRLVGSVAIYEIDDTNNTAEIGKIQIGDKDAHGRGIGRKALVMAMKAGFKKVGITKFIGEVHQKNLTAWANDKKIGFRFVGTKPSEVGGIEDLIEATEQDIASANEYYKEITISGNVE